jgi:hypothetical protein
MDRYLVEVEGERYVVTIREEPAAHFEMLAWVAAPDDHGGSEPTPEQRQACEHMIRHLRQHPPTP